MSRKLIDDPKKLLLKIAEFFEKDPSRWTRGAWARDKDRNFVAGTSSKAYCFCATGAIVSFSENEAVAAVARTALRNVIDGSDIIEWNDTRGPRGAGVVARKFREAAGAL